jgi:voltage-gated potassium channel
MTQPSRTSSASDRKHIGYQIFILALSIWAIGALAASVALPEGSTGHTFLEYADLLVCILFLVDFFVTLATSNDRWKYLITWGWLDLLSSIPMLPAARLGRLARIFRVVRVIRTIRATRLMASLVLQHRAENTFLAAALVGILLTVTCSAAMLHFEMKAEGANIKTAEDAVWWSLVTITTVGYGDRFPVTTEGRLLAVVLMFAGVGLFGTFSAFLASWFIGGMQEEKKSEIEELRQEIRELLDNNRDKATRGD